MILDSELGYLYAKLVGHMNAAEWLAAGEAASLLALRLPKARKAFGEALLLPGALSMLPDDNTALLHLQGVQLTSTLMRAHVQTQKGMG